MLVINNLQACFLAEPTRTVTAARACICFLPTIHNIMRNTLQIENENAITDWNDGDEVSIDGGYHLQLEVFK